MKPVNQMPRAWMWGLLFPLVVLNSWLLLLVFEYFRSLITVFVTATVLSFLLDYPVNFLRRYGVKRQQAVVLVLCLFLLILIVLGVTLAPIILAQLNELVTRLPSWINSGTEQFETLHNWAKNRNLPIDLRGFAKQISERFSTQLQSVVGQILSFVVGAAGSLLDLLITVVLTFYLLLHGQKLWDGLFQWFPSQLGSQIRESLRINFQNYFIGQATLATFMGILMTVAFLILQVPFGLLFGLAVGVMTLIPLGAGLSISIVSLLMALNNFWLGMKVLAVATVLDQVIENGIAPRLLGGFTGLNPVWIFISLLIATKIGGLIGLLVAVPLAGFIKSTVENLRTSSIISESAIEELE
ncbi:AI-2E family transporter [Kamptonema sp. UHCC 0994]|uniref:AI-2E family transporter n=1 Tax=Kamptonema sp. UHCC 0994 TaxID=3031329 RepID=UPI0023BA090D|nr:AI-2E family transporter [Kamptonema sp. UHCC 0994]MDF0554360.1 AI-2E family transporter [Kamptonema sp. UHCC 0994]